MRFFDFGPDFYNEIFVAQKLAWEIGVAVLFAVMAFVGLHMLRRAFGTPVHEAQAEPPPPSVISFQRYEVGARLYHWSNFLVLTLLLWSGTAMFFPGIVFPLLPYVGLSWLTVHVVFAGLFIVFLIIHILFAMFETGLRQMWFWRGDGRDFARRIGYYFGRGRTIPKYGKFDVFQKIYHAFLVIFALVMIGTGVSLFLSSEIIATLSDGWMRWQRILHDIFAFLFAALIIAHIYLRLIRSRWPTLAAMVTGGISRYEFVRQHDWRRWQPHVKESRPQAVREPVAAPPPKGGILR